MRVTATLKGDPDSEGRRTINIRVNEGEDRRFKSTKIKVRPDQFKDGKIVNHPNEKNLNKKLKFQIHDMEVKHSQGVAFRYPDAYLEEYFKKSFSQWKKVKKDSTLYQYRKEGERFVNFAGNLKLSKVTPDILNSYKSYLLKERSSNTAWKTLKFLKTIFHKAIKEKVIEHNPFDQVETIKYKNPKKQFLTVEQVGLIDQYVKRDDTPQILKDTGNWFLIGCYTGLRFSDMSKFSKDKIKNGRLILYTTKTNEPVSLPFNDTLRELFERVDYKHLITDNSRYNQRLKIIANALDLPPIHAHMSRHVFAVRCAAAGISPEVTAKLMGIVNLKVVSIYYKLNNTRIDQEFSKLFE